MSNQVGSREDKIIGSSPAMALVRQLIEVAAASEAPVFVCGESGTGKDLVASAIHAASARAGRPLGRLNCSGVPDDILDRELHGPSGADQPAPYPSAPRYLTEAASGTLVLDDICRASPVLQGRILELLTRRTYVDPNGTTRPLDCRLIASTNADLQASLRNGTLRRDLYDSLAVVVIDLPPLRERGQDAAEIAAAMFPRLLERFGHPAKPLPVATLARIGAMDWPGNVRQLLNVLSRIALSPRPGFPMPADVVPQSRPDPSSGRPARTFAEIEQDVILEAIARNEGSILKAAAELQLAASTIYRKLKGWGPRAD